MKIANAAAEPYAVMQRENLITFTYIGDRVKEETLQPTHSFVNVAIIARYSMRIHPPIVDSTILLPLI